jgi:hypothetical protein
MRQTASKHAAFLNIHGEGIAKTHVPRYLLNLANFHSGAAASLDGTCVAPYDVIIASDLVYSAVGARSLAHTIVANLKRGGVFLMVCTRPCRPLS